MALPVIRGTSAALYPFTVTYSFLTGVTRMQSGYEQRFVKRHGLVKFQLPYANLTRAQKDVVKAAVTSAKGQFDGTLSLTLGATTYTSLSLDSDDFMATESMNTIYAAPLKLSQNIPQGISGGTAGLPFPTLTNGTKGILPFSQGRSFQTVAAKMDAGPKYTFAEFGGGLAGYPTTTLMKWEFDEAMITDVDLAIRVNHFCANRGRFSKFSFTDEDLTTYTGVRYSTDELSVTYRGVNDSSLKITLEQTNN